jgi:type II secretory pathway component PulM
MIENFIKKIFGDPAEKRLKQYQKELEVIKALEAEIKPEFDSIESIQARISEFRA